MTRPLVRPVTSIRAMDAPTEVAGLCSLRDVLPAVLERYGVATLQTRAPTIVTLEESKHDVPIAALAF
jgi:hypothetical protein